MGESSAEAAGTASPGTARSPGPGQRPADATGPRRGLAASLRPLAHPAYRLLWAGWATSSAGNAVAQIAFVFAVLHAGGTATDVGLTEGAASVGFVAFLLAGGVWADRLPRQRVMLGADAVHGIVQAALAAALITGHARIWELAMGSFLHGAASAFFGAASAGLVAETVPPAELQQASSLLGLPGGVLGIAGPAVAGVFIAAFGPGPLLAADAATFAVSAVCLARLKVPSRPLPAPSPFWSDLAEGWREVAGRPWYWINLLAQACVMFAVAFFFVLGPVIAARSLGGPAAWGAISAAGSAGVLAGGLLALRVRPRRPLVAVNLLSMLPALPMLALAFSRSTPLIAVGAALAYLNFVLGGAMWRATVQGLIPDRVRSRVSSYDMLASSVIMPAGLAAAGPLAASLGNAMTLVVGAVLVSAPCALAIVVPGIRGIRRSADGQVLLSEAG
jgi:MFS family permease